ncbi:MAG: hypothetical protein IJO53_00805, partial [Clostridia bacterium]|nr:hypothetical protein [Clostridia bacterium]
DVLSKSVQPTLAPAETEKQEDVVPLADNAVDAVKSRYMLITFPTQTLGGKKVGMEKHYTEWFEARIPENLTIIDRFVIGNELAYTLERKEHGKAFCSGDADRKPE